MPRRLPPPGRRRGCVRDALRPLGAASLAPRAVQGGARLSGDHRVEVGIERQRRPDQRPCLPRSDPRRGGSPRRGRAAGGRECRARWRGRWQRVPRRAARRGGAPRRRRPRRRHRDGCGAPPRGDGPPRPGSRPRVARNSPSTSGSDCRPSRTIRASRRSATGNVACLPPGVGQQPARLEGGPGLVRPLQQADRLAPVAEREPAAGLDDQRRRVSGNQAEGLIRSGQRAVQVTLVPEHQRGLDHHPRDRLGVACPSARLDRPRVEELGSGHVARRPAQMGSTPVRCEPGLQNRRASVPPASPRGRPPSPGPRRRAPQGRAGPAAPG